MTEKDKEKELWPCVVYMENDISDIENLYVRRPLAYRVIDIESGHEYVVRGEGW